MHDPSFLAYTIPAPWLRFDKWKRKGAPNWGVVVQRRTNAENLGERVYPWYRPVGYDVFVAGRHVRSTTFIDIWHDDPNGHDAGSVCALRNKHGKRGPIWFWQHRSHLRAKVIPWQQFKRWKWQRCEGCGGKSRRGHMVNVSGSWNSGPQKFRESKPDMWHMECSSVRHLKYGLEEAQEALRLLNVDQADLELRGMEPDKAWRVIYAASSKATA